jgi:hypothetical protein
MDERFWREVHLFYPRLKQIVKESGRSYLSIILQFIKLRKRIGLEFNEYYYYEFDKQNYEFLETYLSTDEKFKYLGLLNPKKYYIIARNKYFSHLLLASHNISKADLIFYFDPFIKNDGILCNSEDSIYEKLKSIDDFVLKPTEGSQGVGVMVFKRIFKDKNELFFEKYNGEVIPVHNYVKNKPLICEKKIVQSESINQINPTSINTIRCRTLLYPDGKSVVMHAYMRIGRINSCTDNAGMGGNVNGLIDIETGMITQVIRFDGFRKKYFIKEHPDTGFVIEGFRIPNWDFIKSTMIEFQKKITIFKAIGWDVAVTDQGPVIVEMNDFWDNGAQYFFEKGWKNDIRQCYESWLKSSEIQSSR